MATKRILVLADDPSDGENVALELSRGGYAAPRADFRDLPHLMMPNPDLVITCFSPWMEGTVDWAQVPKKMKGVPVLVVSALGLSQLEGLLRSLRSVSAVLFKPYPAANLLKAVRETTRRPVARSWSRDHARWSSAVPALVAAGVG